MSQLSIQSQLVLREQQDVYEYWRDSAGGRPMPQRADIDPVAIPYLLPKLSIIDVPDDGSGLRYRLAGTRLRDAYGCEVTGKRVFGLDFGVKRAYWLEAYNQVIAGGQPMQGSVRAPVSGRDHLILLWLRLPLGVPGRVEKIFGYDAVLPFSVATGTAARGDNDGAAPFLTGRLTG